MSARFLSALLLTALFASPALAHEFRPTVLRVNLDGSGAHGLLWKWDGLDPRGVGADALSFPDGCEAETRNGDDGNERVTHFRLACGDTPLVVTVEAEVPEVVLDLRVDNTPVRVARLTGVSGPLDLPAMAGEAGAIDGFIGWIVVGVEHIIFGPDHLAFVLALTLLVRTWRRIAFVVTGFTLGHSITLSGAAMGLLPEPSSAPVEAVIALSITYLAVELTRSEEAQAAFAQRLGVAVAAGFGLIHGFGFAGALADIGLPEQNAFSALLAFNLGVELGQIAFVAVLLIVANLIRKARGSKEAFPRPVRFACAYWLGAVSFFWLIQRSISIVT